MKDLIRTVAAQAGYEIHHKSLGTGDPFEQQFSLLNGIASPVIFDVGANIGDITRKYRSLFPGAMIYAFEPFSESFACLDRAARKDNRIVACRLAFGGTEGIGVLRVNSSGPTNSLLQTEESAASFWGSGLMETTTTVDVELSTIDTFCDQRDIHEIDVLKIDTQGTELEILRGAIKMLTARKIRLVYMEMIIAPSYKGQAKPHETMYFFDKLGYHIHGFYNLWRRRDGRILQMDAIFVR